MKEDRSLDLVEDDEFPGILFAQISLYTGKPPDRKPLSFNSFEQDS